MILCASMLTAGCTPHSKRPGIIAYIHHDPVFSALPPGPQRVDALWLEALALTETKEEALDLLGELAVDRGLLREHPFNTGLTETGMLAPNDKAGHFFAHAMWRFHDHDRLIPVSEFNGVAWEVVGEVRSWFGIGFGFNRRDIWANYIGRAFGDSVYDYQFGQSVVPLPSTLIEKAEEYRPSELTQQCRTWFPHW